MRPVAVRYGQAAGHPSDGREGHRARHERMCLGRVAEEQQRGESEPPLVHLADADVDVTSVAPDVATDAAGRGSPIGMRGHRRDGRPRGNAEPGGNRPEIRRRAGILVQEVPQPGHPPLREFRLRPGPIGTASNVVSQ